MTNLDLPLPPQGPADDRLQALEAQVQARALFLNAPVAALLLTPDSLIHDLNTLAYGLLVLPTDLPRRLRFRSLLAAGSRAEFDAFVQQVQAVPLPQSREVRVAPEGTPALDVRLDMAVQRSPGRPDLLQELYLPASRIMCATGPDCCGRGWGSRRSPWKRWKSRPCTSSGADSSSSPFFNPWSGT